MSDTDTTAAPDLFGENAYGRVRRSAEISPCGKYRWWLRRAWTTGGDGRVVCFVMLNPSTADAERDDPTLRKCMGYARRWGFSALGVRNLFPWRATDPKELLTLDYVTATGGERGDVELRTARTADLVVCAWGAAVPCHSRNNGRVARALELLVGKPLHCLELTKAGHPKHPLYCRGDLNPIPFDPKGT